MGLRNDTFLTFKLIAKFISEALLEVVSALCRLYLVYSL